MEFDQKYSKTIEGLTDAIYVCDASGYIRVYNPAAAELWGSEPEPGKQLYCGCVKMMNTDGTDLLFEDSPIAITLKYQRPVQDAEFIIERADGSFRHIIQYTTPIFNFSGELMAVVNRQVDITAHRKKRTA
jgi:two-component system, chemotaxis family, CheB/CheR fusion protein